jgi:malate/lactate dehydrogenase
MNILLIGCGRTGRAIAESLLELNYVKKMFLYSRTSKSSKALAHDLDNNKVEVIENISLIKDIDYALITLSGMSDSARAESMNRRSTTYEVRQDELKFNIGAIGYLIKDLNSLSKKTKIIVVTNPVDEITNYIQSMLPNRTILGFGLELDAKRYEKILGKKVLCISSHGRAIPLINAKSEKNYDDLLTKTDSELLDNIRKQGIPHKMAGMSFKNFFEISVFNNAYLLLIRHVIKFIYEAR